MSKNLLQEIHIVHAPSQRMALKSDQFLALSLMPCTRRWDSSKNYFLLKKCTQTNSANFSSRCLHADNFLTSLPENGKDKGKPVKNWPPFLRLSNEGSDFSNDLLRNSSLGGHDSQRMKNIDVTTFGNLCVDIVLNVPTLPPCFFEEKLAYMKNLSESAPDEKFWEAGGNSNFAIAAARLGLHCATLGHVGNEKYGNFLHKVLEEEGVQVIRLDEKKIIIEETLLCWVLVDPNHNHGFCSRFDFNKDPAFKWIKELPLHAQEIIQRSKILFLNGFLFDELTPEVITSTVDFAKETGCVLFFDPGPRGKSLFRGPVDQQHALQKLLRSSDVLLLTGDEAEALTGLADPVLSAKQLLARGHCTKWVVVKMGDKGCLLITAYGVYQVPAFKVDVKDTVGCGDSFAAAIALGYIHGIPIMSALALANAVGAATAMGCGAGRNVATVDDVMKILLASQACRESGQFGNTFSTEQWMKVGIPQLDKQGSMSDCISHDMSLHMVTREAVNLLMETTRSFGSVKLQ